MRSDIVDLHDEAAAEYDAAFDWYLQRSPDAALKFDENTKDLREDSVQLRAAPLKPKPGLNGPPGIEQPPKILSIAKLNIFYVTHCF
ncbi:MAG: hypothetical protein ABSA78_12040 [Candidatus Sulfotelmatobacter sp.]|jgi:hypothetical protein